MTLRALGRRPHDALPRILARIAAREDGWGGNLATGIIGSPQSSTLDHATVLAIVCEEVLR